MDKVVLDALGLVPENQYLTVFIPATGRALVFRVGIRWNRGAEVLHYGPLPLVAGEAMSTYEGGTVSVPADGVIPARAYSDGKSFPMAGVTDETDMWYTKEDYRERLFHIIQCVTPAFLRMDVLIPKGVIQRRFQRDKKTGGVHADFGFSRGMLEVVQLPKIHYGYRWGNDTNIDLRTSCTFVYGEYVVEIPRDAGLIFDILTKKVPSRWISLPITVYDPMVKTALLDTYGFEGFKVYSIDQKGEAVADYTKELTRMRR